MLTIDILHYGNIDYHKLCSNESHEYIFLLGTLTL